jgi:hypothetical protein
MAIGRTGVSISSGSWTVQEDTHPVLADDKRVPLWSLRLAERRVDRDYSYAEVAHRLRTLSREQERSDCA